MTATGCQNAASPHFVSITTTTSLLIQFHAITNTPELNAVCPIDEGRPAAQAEMHAPRAPGILINPRLRPIYGRLDSQKRMARWQGRARRWSG